MFKKLLISLLISLVLFLSAAPYLPSLAIVVPPPPSTNDTDTDQDPPATDNNDADDSTATKVWYNQHPIEWYLKVYDPNLSPSTEIFGERYTAAQIQWIEWGLVSSVLNMAVLGHTEVWVCLFSGSLFDCAEGALKNFIDEIRALIPLAQATSDSSGLTSAAPLNIFSVVGKNPISGIGYLKNVVNRIRLIPEVNAQGFGYEIGASPALILWRISRNISFFFLTLVVIIMAFMIMFRIKINPQTVITVQSSIPKVILALILITFSYAIAGLLIDLMYVVIGLLALLISETGLSSHSPVELFRQFTTDHNVLSLLIWYWLTFMFTSVGSMFTGHITTIVAGFFLLIFAFFSIIILAWYSLKLLVLMFKNFALIILAIITGPFEIMLGAVSPSMGFGSWLNRMISLLLVYPLWALLFFLAFFLVSQADSAGITTTLSFFKEIPFNPAFRQFNANQWDPPLTTGVIVMDNLIWILTSFFVICMTPKVTKIIQAAFQGKPFDYESAVGESMVPLRGAWGMTGAPYARSFQEVYTKKKIADMATRFTSQMATPGTWQSKTPQWVKKVASALKP